MGVVDELVEGCPSPMQVTDSFLEAFAMLEKFLIQHARALVRCGIEAGQQVPDLRAAHSRGEELLNLDDSVDAGRLENSLPRCAAGAAQQPLLFVVAQGPHAHVRPLRQLADTHPNRPSLAP